MVIVKGGNTRNNRPRQNPAKAGGTQRRRRHIPAKMVTTQLHRTVRRRNGSTRTYSENMKAKCKPFCDMASNTWGRFEPDFEKKLKAEHRNERDIERTLVRLFKTPFTPSKITAQNDYYTYINYQWLEKTSDEIKKRARYYVQVDSFRVTQEKVYYELMEIVKEYLSKNKGRKANAIRAVYQSLYNLDNRSIENYVHKCVEMTDALLAKDDMYQLIGKLDQNEIVSWGSPFVWSVMKDEKNTKIYRSYISAPQLSIYDYLIYIEDELDDAETKKYKRAFKQHYLRFIDKMFDLCLGKNTAQRRRVSAQMVWDCEYQLLTALGCTKVKGDDPDGYNVVSTREAKEKYGFDWDKMAKAIGYTRTPSTFICTSLSYLKCAVDMLTKEDAWKSDTWRCYYLYLNFRQMMRFHSKWRLTYFEFHGKFVKGQPAPYPREIYPVFGMSYCFNTFLTNEYIARNQKDQLIQYVNNMGQDLLTVYKRIIKRNTWMSPSTKRYALLKLEHIKLVIGSPKLMREDPVLDYSTKDAYQNMLKMSLWRSKQAIHLDGKMSEVDIPVIDWEELKMVGKQSYVVNAYYTPTENSIYVPLAYLQKPFIDLDERGIEYNLAHIGYTLGHEMSHCLDDMGSKYDYKGNLHNWWTKSDRQKFNAKVRDVVNQYETFAGYDDIDMDATLSTGENLADISGLAICEEYLRDFQEKNDDAVPIRALSFHVFFVYIAIQARQKIFDEAIKAQLKTNPHPLDKYRTNCPLARLKLFQSLYNVKPKDQMYWKTTDTIW